MAGSDLVPTYNLKAVVKETGIKPDTLRAWERRYGLPDPERSSGGHRLYSRRDIDIIKWLISQEADGLSISRAVELWRRLIVDGRDPLQIEAVSAQSRPSPGISLAPQTATEILDLRQSWVDACVGFDEQRAEQILSHAFALYSPEVVVLQLLRQGVVAAGEGWCRGAAIVEQEYFAAELARRRLEALMSSMPPATRPGRVLLAAAPGEVNTLHPLILAFLLRRRGIDALFVGSNVSSSHLQATVTHLRPDLVVLFAHRITAAAGLVELIEVFHPLAVPVGFLGAIFNMLPVLRTSVPGHFLGDELEEATISVESLLASTPSVKPISALSEEYQQAVVQFRERQASIEAEVWRLMSLNAEHHSQLSIANERLGETITAALKLGNIDLLGTEIEWLQCLLEYDCFDPDLLQQYVTAYFEAALVKLDGHGRMVVDWLAALAGR